MHSKTLLPSLFRGLIAYLISPLLSVAPIFAVNANTQSSSPNEADNSPSQSSATIHQGKIQVAPQTLGLEKPKNSDAVGKVVFRDGAVKVNNSHAQVGTDVKSGALIEAASDGRALIVLKRKSAASEKIDTDELLGFKRRPNGIQLKVKKKLNIAANRPTASDNSQSKKPKQMGLSRGIDVNRLQYIALIGDAQAKLSHNEILIETKEGEAIINQGTSRAFSLGPNSKMRVPEQPKGGITGTLCHGSLSGVAKTATNTNGPNIETGSGIVNFPSGGRFFVESAGQGQLIQCIEGSKPPPTEKPSSGIRVVSLDAPGRLILAQRPQPFSQTIQKPENLKNSNKNENKNPPDNLSLTDSSNSETLQRNSGNMEREDNSNRQTGNSAKESKPPQSGKTSDSERKTDSEKSRESDRQKESDVKERTTSNLTSDDSPKTTENEREKTKDKDKAEDLKTTDGKDSDKKESERRKTADNSENAKQQNTGGKNTKPEDSPLDIDQGKGNDKFIGSDAPAAKGAEKRIALNDEKKHDGEDTRQPGDPAKESKPPQSGKTSDSERKTESEKSRESDSQKKSDGKERTTSNLTSDDSPKTTENEREKTKDKNKGEELKTTDGKDSDKNESEKRKTADNNENAEQQNTGGKNTKPEDSPLDIDQGKGNDKFIGSDSPAAKGAEKRIALNDEKKHDGEDTRQPGDPANESKPPQSGKTSETERKMESDKAKPRNDGILEFSAMQDVKAPELPDTKNMSDQERKNVYKTMAEKTESKPVTKSLIENLTNKVPSDTKIVAEQNSEDTQKSSKMEQQNNREISSQENEDGKKSEKSEINENREKENSDISASVNHEREESNKKENSQSNEKTKSGDGEKHSKTPLISPPKLTPPPPPKIDTTQIPLNSEVLIKIRKKVK